MKTIYTERKRLNTKYSPIATDFKSAIESKDLANKEKHSLKMRKLGIKLAKLDEIDGINGRLAKWEGIRANAIESGDEDRVREAEEHLSKWTNEKLVREGEFENLEEE